VWNWKKATAVKRCILGHSLVESMKGKRLGWGWRWRSWSQQFSKLLKVDNKKFPLSRQDLNGFLPCRVQVGIPGSPAIHKSTWVPQNVGYGIITHGYPKFHRWRK
jgi:hypothetical protein